MPLCTISACTRCHVAQYKYILDATMWYHVHIRDATYTVIQKTVLSINVDRFYNCWHTLYALLPSVLLVGQQEGL